MTTPREDLLTALATLHEHVRANGNGAEKVRTNSFYQAVSMLVRSHSPAAFAKPATTPHANSASKPVSRPAPPLKTPPSPSVAPAFLISDQPTGYTDALGEPSVAPVDPWLKPFTDPAEAAAEAELDLPGRRAGLARLLGAEDEDRPPDSREELRPPEPPEPPDVIPPDVRIARPMPAGLMRTPPSKPSESPKPPAGPPPRRRARPGDRDYFGPDAIDDEIPF